MKLLALTRYAPALFLLLALGSSPTGAATAYAPVPVAKTDKTLVLVHYMPWFDGKNPESGRWGRHWTMRNRNPDIIDATGKRQIASHYYPLTGPYASAAPDIIEYQLLLMKLSGIDGVLIDWPGTTKLYDYAGNKRNAEALIARLDKVGLKFAIIYEDQNIRIAADKGVVKDKIAQARADMAYLRDHYFQQNTYINLNGKPLLGVFGPQTFRTAKEWVRIFSVLPTKPSFMTLWNQQAKAGSQGEFLWVYQNDAAHMTHVSKFYNDRPNFGFKFSAAYPGFNDFYKQGGLNKSYFNIPANGTDTFSQTLDLALGSRTGYVQLVTWNDYGEGTMIEPTREFGYSLLTTLQRKLGVSYRQPELELVHSLYLQRNQYRNNAGQQERLTQVFYYLASLQIDKAKALLGKAPTLPVVFTPECQIWETGKTYSGGTIVSYQGKHYKALVTHTATEGVNWSPEATPALWMIMD